MDILYSPRAEVVPVPVPVPRVEDVAAGCGAPLPTRQAGQNQLMCLTVEEGSRDRIGPMNEFEGGGEVLLDMVKLWMVV